MQERISSVVSINSPIRSSVPSQHSLPPDTLTRGLVVVHCGESRATEVQSAKPLRLIWRRR
jgi:hypothetical protein